MGENVDPELIRRLVAEEIVASFGLYGPPCDGADMSKIARLAAACDSINYIDALAPGCGQFGHAWDLPTAGMENRRVEGLFLEFGVYSGGSVNHLASQTEQMVYGFDSFEGLPENWRPDFQAGAFATATIPAVRKNVELVVGWFDQTLPRFVAAHPEPVSLMHVDCDLYSSTKTVFDCLAKQIVSGTVIVFDEYLNYVGWRQHEHKAFQEFIAATGHAYRVLGFVPHHQQLAVQIL